MSEEFTRLMRELDAAKIDEFKKVFKVEGTWYYRDLPKMLNTYFIELVDLMGEDNIRWITLAVYSEKDGSTTKRGQIIYNEQARLNCINFNK